MHTMTTTIAKHVATILAALAIAFVSEIPAWAQDAAAPDPAAAEQPAAEPAEPVAPPASAIPKPADAQAAKPKPSKKTQKAAACDGLFEVACKEAKHCTWSGGLAKADGTAPKAECVKVSKSANKGTKDSCPSMFEALCKETKGCAWTAGTPAAEGQAATAGSCTFEGKSKKKTAAAPPAAPPPPKEPPPDTFTDQSAQ